MARLTLVDAFEIAFQNLYPSIEQRPYREEPFFLSIDEMFGRPPREESEELVGGSIPPIPYVLRESGFLFSSFFFGHISLLLTSLYQEKLSHEFVVAWL